MRPYQGVLLSLVMGLTTWASAVHADGSNRSGDEPPQASEQAVVAADQRIQADKRMLFGLGQILSEDVDALNRDTAQLRDSRARGDRAQVSALREKVLADEERLRHTQHEIVFWQSILKRDQRAARRAREIAAREARHGIRPKTSSS